MKEFIVVLTIVVSGIAYNLGQIKAEHAPRTVIFHIDYGANEDMFECPGTPDRVVSYTSNEDGSADVECVIR